MTAELCYVGVMMDNAYGVGVVKNGESGYFPTGWPLVKTKAEADEWAKHMNDRMKLSDDDVWELVAQSMRKR